MSNGIDNSKLERVGRHWEYHGIFAFSGTDATVEVPVPFNNRITGFAFGHVGTPGTGEILSIDETVVNGGIRTPLGSKFVTVRRAATTTPGLRFSLCLAGE